MLRMHKEVKCVMEILGQNHDKVGNGFPAINFVMKKCNGKFKDEIMKELKKRGASQQTRKLFSIYRYRTKTEIDQNDETSPLLGLKS